MTESKDMKQGRLEADLQLSRRSLLKVLSSSVAIAATTQVGAVAAKIERFNTNNSVTKISDQTPVVLPEFGAYFHGHSDRSSPLPTFAQVKDRLPDPLLDSRPETIAMYWKCWELAFSNLKTPSPDSPLVANWIDAAFSDNIFQWDTCFMMMFARYGEAAFPFIQSLDNFYCRQRPSGYICREINRDTGGEMKYGFNGGFDDPAGWKNSINPPLFAWAECESFKVTGDKSRFASVLPVLEKYVEFLNRDGDPDADPTAWQTQGRRSVGTPHQLYWNTGLGSGMDNTPKPTTKGAGWVDMSCQMVMQYRELVTICRELSLNRKAAAYEAEAKAIGARINKWCWNEQDGFYYDVLADGTQFKKKTAGGFWPMIAGIASAEQVGMLVTHLTDEKEFWRHNVFPTLAADEPEYDQTGRYWLGGVWAPTNYMIIKGLQQCGDEKLAAKSTERYLTSMAAVFNKTGTVWELYAPDSDDPGSNSNGNSAQKDFVGWSGIGPITLLIENVLGFRPDGAHNTLVWRLHLTEAHGINRLSFGTVVASLFYDGKGIVHVTASAPFNLVINGKSYKLKAGDTQLNAWPSELS